jgi:hypothetical protein
MHKVKFGHLQGKLRYDKFNLLKSNLHWQQNVFTVSNKSNEAVVYASFAQLQIIAKDLNNLRMVCL